MGTQLSNSKEVKRDKMKNNLVRMYVFKGKKEHGAKWVNYHVRARTLKEAKKIIRAKWKREVLISTGRLSMHHKKHPAAGTSLDITAYKSWLFHMNKYYHMSGCKMFRQDYNKS
jgi:hypothetical protein